jgi:hypothetical protein
MTSSFITKLMCRGYLTCLLLDAMQIIVKSLSARVSVPFLGVSFADFLKVECWRQCVLTILTCCVVYERLQKNSLLLCSLHVVR